MVPDATQAKHPLLTGKGEASEAWTYLGTTKQSISPYLLIAIVTGGPSSSYP